MKIGFIGLGNVGGLNPQPLNVFCVLGLPETYLHQRRQISRRNRAPLAADFLCCCELLNKDVFLEVRMECRYKY